MKRILYNRKTVLALFIVLFIFIGCAIYLFTTKENNKLLSYKNNVEYKVVEKLYNDAKKTVYNDEKKAVSKVYGYTYDGDGVIIVTVKEGYTLNNKVYDLSDKYIGEYSDETLNSVLEKATNKIYEYVNINGEYVLIK